MKIIYEAVAGDPLAYHAYALCRQSDVFEYPHTHGKARMHALPPTASSVPVSAHIAEYSC